MYLFNVDSVFNCSFPFVHNGNGYCSFVVAVGLNFFFVILFCLPPLPTFEFLGINQVAVVAAFLVVGCSSKQTTRPSIFGNSTSSP